MQNRIPREESITQALTDIEAVVQAVSHDIVTDGNRGEEIHFLSNPQLLFVSELDWGMSE